MNSYLLNTVSKDGNVRGRATCWPISSDIVVTVFHAVSTGVNEIWLHEIEPTEYWMTLDEHGNKVELKPVACDSDADIALLRVSPTNKDQAKLKPLETGEWGASVGAIWRARSFPSLGKSKSLTLTGEITAVSQRAQSIQFELRVAQGNGVSWQGASGSPLEVDGLVVGVLLAEISAASTLRAAGIESVKRLFRIEENAALKDRLIKFVSAQPIARLKALVDKFRLVFTDTIIGQDHLLGQLIVDHGNLYGPKRMVSILQSLGESYERQNLVDDLVSVTVQPELQRWPRQLGTINKTWDRHVGYAIPKSLAKSWTTFIRCARWDKLVKLLVPEIAQSLTSLGGNRDLIRRYEHFNYFASYGNMREVLGGLIPQTLQQSDCVDVFNRHDESVLRDLRAKLRQLKAHIGKDKSSDSCFFVMGSSGAGKTHFLESLINSQATKPGHALVLPIGWPSGDLVTSKMLDEAVLGGLRNATGRNFATLAEFQSELDLIFESENTFLSLIGIVQNKSRTNLVISLDDMQEAMPSHEAGKQLCIALHEVIDQATRFESVRWLVMLRDTSYDRLLNPVGQPSFWEVYGHSWRVPAKAGWVDLDLICAEDQVGWGILTKGFGETWAASQSEVMKELPNRQNIAQNYYLELPWFAWVLQSMGMSWCSDALRTGDLNHLQVVLRLREIKINPLGATIDERQRIDRYMRTIAAAMMPSDGQRTYDQDFIDDVARLTGEAKFLFEANELSFEVERLTSASLLKQITQDLMSLLEVRLVMIWGYLGAQYLKHVLKGKDTKAISIRLHEDLANMSGDGLYFKESVLEFLLMIADQESSILVECILGLTTRNLGATQVAVLFAAPKLSLELQLRLCNQNSISQPAMSAPNFHKRALLAKMMFSERASPDALSAWQRIDMLREEYLNIYSFGYAGFYLSVVDRILSHVTDIHVLEKCMQSLRGCELVGVASPLAISVVKQMFVLAPANSNKSKFEELTMLIVRYAKSSAEAVEIDDQDYRIGAKGHQHGIDSQSLSKYNFFTLLVLREYCDLLVEELGPLPTFYLLEKHKWFSVVSTRYLVGRAMEEQAHTSIGRYFHGKAVMFHKSNGPGAEFIRLIDDLVGSASAHKRTQAMYLMRHTRPTYGQKRVKIDSCFIRHLELLSKDPKVSKMDDFKGVYEATIGVNWPQYGRRRSPKKRDQSKKFS